MAQSLITAASTLQCPHGGQVQIVSANGKVRAGAAVALVSDTFTISGCTSVPVVSQPLSWRMRSQPSGPQARSTARRPRPGPSRSRMRRPAGSHTSDWRRRRSSSDC